jgi:hypothetical protein
MKTNVVCAILFCLPTVGIVYAEQTDKDKEPLSELARELSQLVKQEKTNIGVGNFLFENTSLMSPLSSLLREELEMQLRKFDKFKVIARDRIADLEMEGQYQASIVEPGNKLKPFQIAGIDGIIRGRFYVAGDKLTIYTELAWLNGGELQKSKIVIPIASAAARIWPDTSPDGERIKSLVNPQHQEESTANVQQVTEQKLLKISQDFPIRIATTDGNSAYQEGETVSFRVRSAIDCHIVVICHQSDGNSIVLFPNRFMQNTLIMAEKVIDVPGTHKSGFEIVIGPPFGTDVVQVIACSKASALHEKLAAHAKSGLQLESQYEVVSRGMMVKGISEAAGQEAEDTNRPEKWAEAHVMVSSFPKLKK